jgi:hypothetical protein
MMFSQSELDIRCEWDENGVQERKGFSWPRFIALSTSLKTNRTVNDWTITFASPLNALVLSPTMASKAIRKPATTPLAS